METEIIARLKEEGYPLVEIYDDSPNEEFPDHNHDGDEILVVLRGDIEVKMEGKTHLLKTNDRLYIPAKTVHSARVGTEGCRYIVGEKNN